MALAGTDPDLMDEDQWKLMHQPLLLTDREWEKLKSKGLVKFPEKETKIEHVVSDEDLLRYLFTDPEYAPLALSCLDGEDITQLIALARKEMGDLLQDKDTWDFISNVRKT
jgi:hypothetical protein